MSLFFQIPLGMLLGRHSERDMLFVKQENILKNNS